MISIADSEPVYFLSPEEIRDKADAIFQAKKKEILSHLSGIDVDIQHVGSCAIPGAWGKFDIDIQIRVTADVFEQVSSIVKQVYDHKHPEIWTDEFVAFCDNKEYLIDIMVTVIDSRYDDFYRVRDYLTKHPEALEKYNNLKKQYNGKPYGEYRKAKKEFLGSNGNVPFLEYN
jgi:GrpB-like predicted nucleotidyltransferase (UPF0157 family)